MKIRLFNTLSKKKEEFFPLHDGEVKMYNCGPTVYYDAHIGNLRSYVFADILRRMFEYNGFKVRQIINITDIGHLTSDADEGEDKMVKAIIREKKPMTLDSVREIADFYFERFKKDLEELNIKAPDKFTFASDHLNEEIALIKTLEDKGFTYRTSDGIYFDTSKMTDYGKLGGSVSDSDEHSRIGVNPEKMNSRDFALWKFSTSNIGFLSPWGVGFPGWHIECSAMAMTYLGETIDVHTGGVDHIPVHHNNEIAQSECATGQPFVRYWMHNEFLTVPDGKMSKSAENFLTLSSLTEKNISPLAYRYWLLTARYSTRIDFSLEAPSSAQIAFKKLTEAVANISEVGNISEKYRKEFSGAINDDLDTPKALSIVWEVLKDSSLSDADKKATILNFDEVLGLGLGSAEIETFDIPEEVTKLLEERKHAKAKKDFKVADEIRDKIRELGFDIKDTKEEQAIYRL